MNLGEIIEAYCDLEGRPIDNPNDFTFTVKRKFKLIGIDSKSSKYLLELHSNSPFGIKANLLNLNNFKLFNKIDTKDLLLLKVWIAGENSVIKKEKELTQGASCIHCDDYYQYGMSNRKDGQFICYSCRTSVGWKYPDV